MDASQLRSDVASAAWTSWHHIPWSDSIQVVARLQTRITKAANAGNWRTVKRLQRLLTQSSSAKALAVRRVTENRGRKTPGIDGETWSSPNDKWQAISTLSERGYRPKPLRRIHIPKSSGGTRPLGIPTMRDRAMQALYLLALDPVAEAIGDPHSYGFRRERSTTDAITQCFNVLCRGKSAKWVLEGDIKGCFDNIDHDWLATHIPLDKLMLRKWLKSGFMEKGALFPTKAGTPQGGIISPVLANLTLDGLQKLLDAKTAQKDKVNFVRYADDFIITGATEEILIKKVMPLVAEFLSERGLRLSETKTKITHISEGFDFLGWNVRQQGNMLLVKPADKNVKAFLTKVRQALQELKGASQDEVIRVLHPMLRGWANYHRTQMASRTFAKCDHRIFEALWHWAKRRHPNKGDRWIKNRYFVARSGRDWRFATKAGATLLTLASFTKVRHAKVKAEANPYNPTWNNYFSERLARKMSSSLAGRQRLRWLWRWQEGLCPICHHVITKETGWHLHHVTPRSQGGTDQLSNLALLHPNCHMQLHTLERS